MKPTNNTKDQAHQPPTSPIIDFSDNDHEGLPSLHQIINNKPTRAVLISEQAIKKKEWLEQLKMSSTNTKDIIELPDSDSDIDIIDQPTLTTSAKHHLDPLKQRLTRVHPNSKSNKTQLQPLNSRLGSNPIPVASSSKIEMNTNAKKSKNLMNHLLNKSAYDNAITRKKKRAEFLARGGRVTARELTMTNNPNPSEIERGNVKTILQNHKKTSELNPNNDDDDEDLDYNCDDDLGSVDEDKNSQEEEDRSNQTEDELDEDEIENSDQEDQLTHRAAELPRPDSSSTYKPVALMPPPVPARSSISSSSSAASSSVSFMTSKPPPSGQTGLTSIILAPDSTSTGRESSRSSEPSEPGKVQPLPESSSPIDLPGFQFEEPTQSAKNKLTLDSSPPLTGFGNVECSGIDGLSDIEGLPTNSPQKPTGNGVDEESGFSQFFGEDEAEATFTHPPPMLKPKKIPISDDEHDNDGCKIRPVAKPLVPADDDDDDMNEIDATCVLPAVNVLPEEKERDMMMMALGAQDTAVEDDEQPTQYVNHRGLLTQNKPNGPPDSPLMSQDLIARTPFALRKDNSNRQGRASIQREADVSPTKNQGVPSSWRVIRSASPESAPKQPVGVVNAFAKVMNAQKEQSSDTFKSPSVPNKKTWGGEGAGKVFLADEADESEDEYEGLLGRRRRGEGGPGSDDENGSDEEGSLKDLVDDAEDERDEQTRMKDELARRELDQKYHEEVEQRKDDHIQKIVDGKIRLRQARQNRSGDAAISESDSEDDLEAQLLKANKRAQEHAAKKRKRAIHQLADKHAPFFKSYEEGTSNLVDDDDLAYLQPQEETKRIYNPDEDEEEDEEDDGEGHGYREEEEVEEGKEEEEEGEEEEEEEEEEEVEDDDDELPDDVFRQGPKQSKKRIGQNVGNEDEEGGGSKKKGAKRAKLSSSPVLSSVNLPLPFNITTNNLLHQNLRTKFSSKKDSPSLGKEASTDQHEDLDELYRAGKTPKDVLSDRQRRFLVAESSHSSGSGPLGRDGRSSARDGEGQSSTTTRRIGLNKTSGSTNRGTAMSSSVTFRSFHKPTDPHTSLDKIPSRALGSASSGAGLKFPPRANGPTKDSLSVGRLAKLKNKPARLPAPPS